MTRQDIERELTTCDKPTIRLWPEARHEFNLGSFGPTTAPLCQDCGLSEQAITHKKAQPQRVSWLDKLCGGSGAIFP